MGELIDFTNCKKLKKGFGGANGKKISIIFNDEIYMLKFSSKSTRNKNLVYKKDVFSEYLSCHILESLGLPAQKTILGTYKVGDENKTCIACKDFTTADWQAMSFAEFSNRIVDSDASGFSVELSDIDHTFSSQNDFEPEILKSFFWDTFIADALIGNWDRHNGNWGFLYNFREDKIKLAPLYDCGSALYPEADESTIDLVLNDENELKVRIYERPYSALKINCKNINYYDFISSLKNEDCNNALKRIFPKIDLAKINSIIENCPALCEKEKNFYKLMILKRKELILEKAYKKLMM